MHRRVVHPEPHQASARARAERRAGAADRPRRPDGARPPARFDGWAETLKDHPEATPQVLDAFCRNLYAPGFVALSTASTAPSSRQSAPRVSCWRQRRGAPLPDLRGTLEAAPRLRIHRGVEERRSPDLGENAGQGVLREAHAVRGLGITSGGPPASPSPGPLTANSRSGQVERVGQIAERRSAIGGDRGIAALPDPAASAGQIAW